MASVFVSKYFIQEGHFVAKSLIYKGRLAEADFILFCSLESVMI